MSDGPAGIIPPGATIGILGSGQLGRMIALAARPLGYHVKVFSPDPPGSPAGQVADREVRGAYDDAAALRRFASGVDVVTVEFENVPATALAEIAELVPVRPGAAALHAVQDRLREKRFLEGIGAPVAPFVAVPTSAELQPALERIGMPAVLKTTGSGYDGKGQRIIRSADDLPAAMALAAEQPCVLEAFVPFAREISVILARDPAGGIAAWQPFRNVHENHILDLTTAGEEEGGLAARATELGAAVAAGLGYVGVLCVEMFVTQGGGLLVNEIAPRVHNSGHVTIEAARTSQFEQHVRAICGLPLGPVALSSPGAMANILGDAWDGGEPDWAAALALPDVKVHLYGKAEARPGRKMGHLTALAPTAAQAAELVREARRRLAAG